MDCRRVVLEGGEEVVKRVAGGVEGSGREFLAPSLLEFGHRASGSVEQVAAFGRRVDELRSAIGGIGLAYEVAEVLELVDEFGAGWQAQVGPVRQRGEPDPVDADIPPDLEVRVAQVRKARVPLPCGEELGAKAVQEPHEELTDRQPIGW